MKNLGLKSPYAHYLKANTLNIKDLDEAINIIKEMHPEYLESALEYLHGEKFYFCNMFVMKKDLFFEYSEWLFSILFEFEKRVDMSTYSTETLRTPGHLSERLFGVYLTHKLKKENLKIDKRPVVHFINTEKEEIIKPAFAENNIPVCLSSSEFYVPYCATTIKSIINNASVDKNYDIIVLEESISKKSKHKILSMAYEYENISIRFFNVKNRVNKYNLYTSEFSIETFYRLLLIDIMEHYSKTIYLDVDLIVTRITG